MLSGIGDHAANCGGDSGLLCEYDALEAPTVLLLKLKSATFLVLPLENSRGAALHPWSETIRASSPLAFYVTHYSEL